MAEVVFIGGAEAVAQIATIVVANTWTAADTVTVTCNGKTLTLTVGATVTTTAVATAIKEMINGDDITGDATRSNTGDNIPEFTEFTATVNSSTVTITGNTAGKPFTISVGETTASTGTATLTLAATAATGPNHWSNADNWDTGSVPVSTDDVVLDGRALNDILYGLDQNAVTLASLTISKSFTKKLGLLPINVDVTSESYPEYRDTYLKISATLLSIEGIGAGSSRIKINLGSNASTMSISSRGTTESSNSNVPPVLIVGTHASNVARITRGNVGFAFYDKEAAHLATLTVGFEDNQSGNSTVICGDGVDLENAAITQSGGTLTIDSTTSSGTIVQSGGTLIVRSAAHAAITADGTLQYNGVGTVTALNSSGGTLDFRQGSGGVIVSACVVGKGTTIQDPAKRVTWTTGIDLYRCGISDIPTFDLGKHFTVTPSSI
jgi:hypothetical protein